MKTSVVRKLGLFILGAMVAAPGLAAEIITEEDIKQEIITEVQLVRLADNAIFLFDTSSSMKRPFRDTGESKYDLVVSEFKSRNSYFPEIGHTFGLFAYTPWKEMYPVQEFDRKKFAAALNSLPAEPKGPTLLREALGTVDPILEALSGTTIVFLFTDGTYTTDEESPIKQKPILELFQELAAKHDACFYLISTATEEANQKMLAAVSEINACSRVIPLEDFLDRPEYSSGSLFEVKATETIVTVMEERIVGLKVKNVTFRFDKDNIRTKDLPELNEVAAFLNEYPEAYIVLRGYTDSVGKDEYNLKLSKRRAMAVADYLAETHGIDPSRMVVQWNGSANPVASNDTEEGRELNRRVEMLITGL